MDFALSDEQEAFRATLRRFLEARSRSEDVRRAMESERGWEPALWRQLAEELALPGLAVPETHGGAGFGFVELVVAFEELGRALACAPCFSTMALATPALLAAGTHADQARYLPALARGERTATLAWLEDAPTQARRDGDRWLVRGTKRFVVDGHTADDVLVAARLPGAAAGDAALALFAVEGGAPGLGRAPLATLDATRKLADLTFTDVPAVRLGDGRDAAPALAAVLDRAATCLAAEMAGGAARCLEMAVDYAKIRVQFARPIGSFQAIKHKCAEVLLEVESARAAAYWAGWVASEEPAQLPVAAAVAVSLCAEAYARAAAESVQIHGGIGFTWEHDAHLYVKRAKASELLLGDPIAHRTRLAAHLGL